MTVNYTTLLGLAQPVPGTEVGTWGTTINNSLTALIESATAGTTSKDVTAAGDWTLTTTGSGAANEQRMAIIRPFGTPGASRNIIAPAQSKIYVVVNDSNGAVVFKSSTSTGVTIPAGKTTMIAWNSAASSPDFAEVTPSTISGTLPVANGGTGATTLTGVLKGNGTSAFTAASSGTDYSAGTSALATGILKSTTTTGALTIAVAADFPTLNQSTTGTAATATNLASGSAGTIPYQSASGTTAMLAAGTSGQVLTSAGTSAPTWSTPFAATKTISNKTAAYTVVAGDLGKIINCTSGTFTVSLTAAASLGSGFTCTIWNTSNTSTDAITIDPNASETIDGVATLILRRGEGMDIVCNGTNWQTSYKKVMRGYTENTNSADTRPIASGTGALALGVGTNTSGLYAISVGYLASATSTYGFAGGTNSAGSGAVTATGLGAMALGGSYASGTDSFAAGIVNNTSTYGATEANSVAIGLQNKASGLYSLCAGINGIASGSVSIAIGHTCTSSVSRAIAIGSSSMATAFYAVAIGLEAESSKYGKYTYASGKFVAVGDAQSGKLVIRASTTTSTSVILTSDGSSASTTNQLIVASGQAMAIQGTLIAKQSGSGNMAGWNITGIVSNNGGTMAVSGLALTPIGVDSIVLGVNLPTIAVDNTNKGVTITSGYKSATTIHWVATLNTSETLVA